MKGFEKLFWDFVKRYSSVFQEKTLNRAEAITLANKVSTEILQWLEKNGFELMLVKKRDGLILGFSFKDKERREMYSLNLDATEFREFNDIEKTMKNKVYLSQPFRENKLWFGQIYKKSGISLAKQTNNGWEKLFVAWDEVVKNE